MLSKLTIINQQQLKQVLGQGPVATDNILVPVVVGGRLEIDVGAPAVVVVVTETHPGSRVALSCGASPETKPASNESNIPMESRKKLNGKRYNF